MGSRLKQNNKAIFKQLTYFSRPGVNSLVKASIRLEVGVFPLVVDSLAVVVIGDGGWEKNYSWFPSISQWQMVINHEGRVSVVLRMYNLINKIPASIV